METELRSSTLEVNGWRFEALAAGPSDGELVLLLHGFPQFADSWAPLAGTLGAAGYHPVAVSQRGYSAGARPVDVAGYDLRQLTADAVGFADLLGAGGLGAGSLGAGSLGAKSSGAGRFHVVGHDWGAVLAWKVAAMLPERVRSVTALAVPHPDAFFKAVRGDLDQMWRSKYIALFKMPGHAAERLLLADGARLLRKVYGGKVPAERVEENVQRLSEPGALTAALNWYRALGLQPSETGRIRVPTLYVWGDQDVALGETAALATAGYVDAPYRFERVVGGSHWLLEEFPERMEQVVLAQLRRSIQG